MRGLKRTLRPWNASWLDYPRLPLKGKLDPDRVMTAEEQAMANTCSGSKYWGCQFGTPLSNESKATCLESYDRHRQEVIDTIPADRLLLFNLRPLARGRGKKKKRLKVTVGSRSASS